MHSSLAVQKQATRSGNTFSLTTLHATKQPRTQLLREGAKTILNRDILHSTIYPENQPATRYTLGATIQNTKCQDSRTTFSYKSSSESTDAAVGTVSNVQYNIYDVIWPCRVKVMHNKHTNTLV